MEELAHLFLHALAHLTPLNTLETVTTLTISTPCYLRETHTMHRCAIEAEYNYTVHNSNNYFYGRSNSLSAINWSKVNEVS